MRKFICFLLMVWLQVYSAQADCSPPARHETFFRHPPQLIDNKHQLQQQQKSLYHAPERLAKRFYRTEDGYRAPFQKQSITLDPLFFDNLSRHIELALWMESADVINYADMGHAHLFVRQDPRERSLNQLIQDNAVVVLYHTAELFNFSRQNRANDPWLHQRYLTRNLLAPDLGSGQLSVIKAVNDPFNTVRTLDGHVSIATLYFTANHRGCFSYRHRQQTFYYDVTFAKPRF